MVIPDSLICIFRTKTRQQYKCLWPGTVFMSLDVAPDSKCFLGESFEAFEILTRLICDGMTAEIVVCSYQDTGLIHIHFYKRLYKCQYKNSNNIIYYLPIGKHILYIDIVWSNQLAILEEWVARAPNHLRIFC